MTATILPVPKALFFDNNGLPLAGGKVFTYAAGTSTPQASYTDSTGTVPNTNPVILDSTGRANIWLVGIYKIVVQDSLGNQIYVTDNISDLSTQIGAAFGNVLNYWAGTSSGTANAITLNSTGITAYQTGQTFRFIAFQTNTGASSLNVNNYGGKSILKSSGTALIPLVAGDIIANTIVEVEYDGTEFQLLSPIIYTPPVFGYGECKLSKSGSNILLMPFNGNKITINGTIQAIPSAGISLPPTGLTASTLYYIYAFLSSGVMTLEASTTVHATDTNTGVEIKSGDATRTLVGMVRPVTGPNFADTQAQRFTISWFNRSSIQGQSSFTANRNCSTTSYSEVNTEIRNEFLIWSDQNIINSCNGGVLLSAGAQAYNALAYNGIALEDGSASGVSSLSSIAPGITYTKTGLTEGYNYVTLVAKTSANTLTYNGGAAGTDRTSLISFIH